MGDKWVSAGTSTATPAPAGYSGPSTRETVARGARMPPVASKCLIHVPAKGRLADGPGRVEVAKGVQSSQAYAHGSQAKKAFHNA